MHRFFKKIALCFLFTALALLSGCAAKPQESEARPTIETYITTTVGGRPISVQVAIREPERQRGLMFREQMDEHAGMLFVFERPQPLGFWMKNTRIPLDIAYITPDGIVREIYPMFPYNEDSVQSLRRDLSMALEMNQGWFNANQVRPGAQLDLQPVLELMRKRGLAPENYAIEVKP